MAGGAVPDTPAKATDSKVNRVQIRVSAASKRKEDALALAYLVYDIFIEEGRGDKVENGQNNANQTKHT